MPISPTGSAARPPMLTTAEALAPLLTAARPVGGVESVDTYAALGRILAADVVSPLDVPPMHTSSMDGYAVRTADLAGASPTHAVTLPVSQRVPAGPPGAAARIFTGATVPPGADAIVMQEMAGATEGGVTFSHTPLPGEWIAQ